MRKFLILITFIFVNGFLWAQPGISKKIERNGKFYYEHHVQKGNTLWGLHKMYNVSIEEIIRDNPGVENGVKEGQIVYIPVKDKGQTQINKVKTTYYTVQKKETLYGLSKKFNTTIDELIRLNPELEKEGLKKGQKILVPVIEAVDHHQIKDEEVRDDENIANPFVTEEEERIDEEEKEIKIVFEDSIVRHQVLPHETLYSISKRFMVSIPELMKVNNLKTTKIHTGQILIIPIKKEKTQVAVRPVPDIEEEDFTEEYVFEEKDHYKIAVLLPFYLNTKECKGIKKIYRNIALDFYSGMELAAQELMGKGLNATIRFFDTKGDSATISKLLRDKFFDDVDLIIGPINKKGISRVAEFCFENKVRCVSPVRINMDLLESNPFVYASITPKVVLAENLAKALTKETGGRLILIKPKSKDQKGLVLYEAFLKAYKDNAENVSPVLIETNSKDFNVHISRNQMNRIVYLTEDKYDVSSFINQMNRSAFRANPGKIEIYGMKKWISGNYVNYSYLDKYHFHFPTSMYMDYADEEVIKFHHKLRDLFKIDLSKEVAHGHDVLNYFANVFFIKDGEKPFLLINDFKMEKVSEQGGYQNTKTFVIQMQDLKLVPKGNNED